jgi:GH25 family lysozyme M1 (1,4-beta-N-acetylmuramidase)/uncharacterized protein (DUF2141 family)
MSRRLSAVAAGKVLESLERRLLMSRVQGIDVSHWQGTINWSSVVGAGKQFAFQKGTEGVTYVDPTASTNTAGAQAAGVLIGVYHFAHPETNSAVAEANWFVQNAGQYMTSGFLHPVLDLESGSTIGRTALSQWVNNWCSTVQASIGVDPIIYCNTNYATNYLDSTVTTHDLWIANWSTSYGDPLTTGSPPTGAWGSAGQTWDFWQYSSTGAVSGISGNVDLDVYNGDYATLQSNFVIGSTPPTPGTIAGSLFLDNNGNGALDTGESLIPDRTVYIDANNNAALDTGELSTLTDSTGHYSFSVNPGTYTVRQVVPAGWYQTVPASNAGRTATVTSGGTTNLFAFGSAQYCSISGSIFRDTNGNGTWDTGESALASTTVYIDANNNGRFDAGELSTVSDAAGNWSLSNVTVGTYTVRVVVKKRSVVTAPPGGAYTHTLFSGTTITGDLFGVK